jgi:ribose-phosphate pyrophosphokinase
MNLPADLPAEKLLEGVRLFSGSANQPLAQSVAAHLGMKLSQVSITSLPDSEIHVQIEELVRHQDVFIIQPCSRPVNDNLIELLLMIDACRRASVGRINLVIPYFPYARQDRMAQGREAISAKVVACMLEALGADRVAYVDIHSLQTQGFFNIPVDPLTAMPTLAAYFEKDPRFSPEDSVIVAPDLGRAKLAGKFAEHLGMDLVIMHKDRIDATHTRTSAIVGNVTDKTVILIDDMIASGSVLDQIPSLLNAGSRTPVYLAITHPVLLDSALRRLDRDYIGELVTTDTIYLPPERRHPKVKIQSIAATLAIAIQHIHAGKSVSSLLRLI